LLQRIVEGDDPVRDAFHYVLWLEQQGRLEAAVRWLEPALREGPDFGRSELGSLSLLTAMEEAWRRIHERMGVTPLRWGGQIYNEGIAASFRADWRGMVEAITDPEAAPPE
jgi:hypothetical protein